MSTRPKQDGLWVRLTLADGHTVDGIIPHNLLLCKAWLEIKVWPIGDGRKLVLPVKYPRSEVRGCVVLGVIGARQFETPPALKSWLSTPRLTRLR